MSWRNLNPVAKLTQAWFLPAYLMRRVGYVTREALGRCGRLGRFSKIKKVLTTKWSAIKIGKL